MVWRCIQNMARLDNDLITFEDEGRFEQVLNKPTRGGHKAMSHDAFVEKMAQLQPDLIVVSNYINKRTKVRCKCRTCGFEWEALPQGFYKSKGCLRCNGFYRRTHEEFVCELKAINPTIEVVGDFQSIRAQIKCRCRICGNEWMSRPGALLQGYSCAKCQHAKMRKTHDDFVAEIASILPSVLIIGEYAGNDSTIRCQCKDCGYEWDGHPRHLRRGQGCVVCSRRRMAERKRRDPQDFLLEAEKSNSKIKIIGTYVDAKTKIDCQCKRCGYVWKMLPGNIMKLRGCPECSKNQTSCFERYVLLAFQKVFGKENVLARDKTAISKELDIYVPDLKVAIEPGRWYWHQRKFNKDKEKYELCKQHGIRLITIYDEFDDDRNKLQINGDFITYAYKLGGADKKEELIACVRELFGLLGLSYLLSKEDESAMFDVAQATTARKTTEEIQKEVREIHPSIRLLDHYVNSKIKMLCHCDDCGHEWKQLTYSLITLGIGCPTCTSIQKYVVNLDTGETFAHLIDAAKSVGCNASSVGAVCRGKREVCCGYRWSYLSNLTESQLTNLRTKFPDTFKY